SHGTLSVITNLAGLNGSPNTDSATVVYTPNANYNGPDSFTYKVTDTGDGASPALDSDPATVSITVSPVNDKPTADSKIVSTLEDTAKTITLSGSDTESVNLTFTILSGPAHGTLSVVTNLAGTPASPNTDTATVVY